MAYVVSDEVDGILRQMIADHVTWWQGHLSTMSEDAKRQLGELLGLAIPLCNVLAVVTLIWFSARPEGHAARARMTLLALVRNFAKNWLAHDGLWFQAVERSHDLEHAVELDVETWRRFSPIEARRPVSMTWWAITVRSR